MYQRRLVCISPVRDPANLQDIFRSYISGVAASVTLIQILFRTSLYVEFDKRIRKNVGFTPEAIWGRFAGEKKSDAEILVVLYLKLNKRYEDKQVVTTYHFAYIMEELGLAPQNETVP